MDRRRPLRGLGIDAKQVNLALTREKQFGGTITSVISMA